MRIFRMKTSPEIPVKSKSHHYSLWNLAAPWPSSSLRHYNRNLLSP